MISVEEINMLQSQNQGLKKQNASLQKELIELKTRYLNVLKLAKENADANEYCLQTLEKEIEKLRGNNVL